VVDEKSIDKIIKEYSLSPHSLRSGKTRKGFSRCGMFDIAEKKLLQELKLKRARGTRCSPRWVSRRMMQIVHETYLNSPLKEESERFSACKNWRKRFYNRHNLVTRKRTNKKALDMNVRISKWQAYHYKLRKLQVVVTSKIQNMESTSLKIDTTSIKFHV
jgi:hypothetical protein